MVHIFWDASSLLKRYYLEVESETVDALFGDQIALHMVATVLGYAETYSILLQKRNAGSLNRLTFDVAVTALEEEVLLSSTIDLLETDSSSILAGITLMRRHNINSSDAAILAAFLRYSQSSPFSTQSCVLVASDKRLLRAAEAEGLATLNPEQVSADDVPTRLAAL